MGTVTTGVVTNTVTTAAIHRQQQAEYRDLRALCAAFHVRCDLP